jgi:hypothetical protein
MRRISLGKLNQCEAVMSLLDMKKSRKTIFQDESHMHVAIILAATSENERSESRSEKESSSKAIKTKVATIQAFPSRAKEHFLSAAFIFCCQN